MSDKLKEQKHGGKIKVRVNRSPHLPNHAGVYLMTDKDTGLKYVGSSQNVNVRAGNYSAANTTNFYRGMLKDIGSHTLEFELLEDCKYLTKDQRLKLEAEYIVKLNTLKPNGLNSVLPTLNKPAKNIIPLIRRKKTKEIKTIKGNAGRMWNNLERTGN